MKPVTVLVSHRPPHNIHIYVYTYSRGIFWSMSVELKIWNPGFEAILGPMSRAVNSSPFGSFCWSYLVKNHSFVILHSQSHTRSSGSPWFPYNFKGAKGFNIFPGSLLLEFAHHQGFRLDEIPSWTPTHVLGFIKVPAIALYVSALVWMFACVSALAGMFWLVCRQYWINIILERPADDIGIRIGQNWANLSEWSEF